MKTRLRIVLLLAGLALFGWFIHHAGWERLRAAFTELGWWAPLALAPYAVVFTIDTIGWRFTFCGAAAVVRFVPFWFIRLAGEAVNNVIPSMYVGGEAAKVYLLHKRGVPVVTSTSASIRSKTAQSVAQSIFIAMGATVAAWQLPDSQQTAKVIFGVIAGGAFAFMAALFWLQRRGMTVTLLSAVRRLGFRLKWLDAREEKLRQLDRKIYGFYTEDRRSFYWCTGSYLAGWMFDIVEIMLVAHLLGFGAEVSWAHAFAIEAFISVARGFNTVVPGALGVQDFSVVGLFKLFGLPDELGLKYAIIRRGRDVVFAVLGWAFLYFDEATLRGFQKRLTEEAEEMEREQSG